MTKVDFGLDDYEQPLWGQAKTITAFRPGQASYEYLAAGANHSGSGAFASSSTHVCTSCHGSNQSRPPFVSATFDEDDPVPEMATVDITVQAAYDATKFYLKASWEAERPGLTHGIKTYRDGAWVSNSTANEPGAADELEEGEVFAAEDRFGVMFMPESKDVSTGISFHSAGCWVTCHADMDDMPEWNEDEEEVTKYLKSSSPALGQYGVSTGDSAANDAEKAAGAFPDMRHWRGGRSAGVQSLTDGYVIGNRASDSGSHNYTDNSFAEDANGWMYDAEWMADFIAENFPGYVGETEVNAFPGALWDAALQNAPHLIVAGAGANAVPFEADAAFPEGSIIPSRFLTPPSELAANGGSRNDVHAVSGWEDGRWTVIFERALDTGNGDDHEINFAADSYTFGFAAFQDHTQHRWHHVTFPVTLGMEGTWSDIRAKFN